MSVASHLNFLERQQSAEFQSATWPVYLRRTRRDKVRQGATSRSTVFSIWSARGAPCVRACVCASCALSRSLSLSLSLSRSLALSLARSLSLRGGFGVCAHVRVRACVCACVRVCAHVSPCRCFSRKLSPFHVNLATATGTIMIPVGHAAVDVRWPEIVAFPVLVIITRVDVKALVP